MRISITIIATAFVMASAQAAERAPPFPDVLAKCIAAYDMRPPECTASYNEYLAPCGPEPYVGMPNFNAVMDCRDLRVDAVLEAQEKVRKAALAKMTDEDKRAVSWGTYVAVGNLCAYNGIVERQLVEEFAAVAERIAIARGTEKYYREGLQSGRRIPILRQPRPFGGYYDRHPNLDQSVCYDIKVPMANFVWEAKKAGWDKP